MTKLDKQRNRSIYMLIGIMVLIFLGARYWDKNYNQKEKPEPKPKQEQIHVEPTEAVNEMTLYRYKNGEIGTLPNHPQAGRGEQIFNR